MKLDCVITSVNNNPLYIDFIPLFITTWKKLYSNVDVIIVLIANKIPNKYLNYSKNIILFEPLNNISSVFISQYIRLLYPCILNYEHGILITDIDMIPMNKTYFTTNIKKYNNNCFITFRDIKLNNEIAMCYNIATNKIWRDVFKINSINDIIERLIYKYNNIKSKDKDYIWSFDQIDLYNYIIKWKNITNNYIILKDSETKFFRLNRTENFILTNDIILNITNNKYTDYHCLRPYNKYSNINNKINNYIMIDNRIIYVFWTDTNPLTENRKTSLINLKKISGCKINYINISNLDKYILKEHPLHPAYKYLSAVHKSDYLRTYFMRFYGGGYSDIKTPTDSWINSFSKLYNTNDKWIIGYPETYDGAVKHHKKYYKYLIGNGAYICKKNTPLVIEWYNELINILDEKLELLKNNPAKHHRDHSEEKDSNYPIGWNEILGRIFHGVIYKYRDKVLNTLPTIICDSYR
jgi:hypothetical protein